MDKRTGHRVFFSKDEAIFSDTYETSVLGCTVVGILDIPARAVGE